MRTRRRTGAPPRPWRTGRGRLAAWGLAALVLAVLAVGAGAGMGLPRLGGAAGVAWLALLVVGLVLAVAAVVLLARAGGRWWGLVIVPLTLVAVVLGAYVVGMPLAVAAAPASRLGAATPEGVGLAYEDVVVPTSDGERLAAWYVPSRTGAAVVLLHGSGGSRTGVLDQLAVLAARGYGVLAVDARGHGASEGCANRWGWYGDSDVPAAVTVLAARPDVDPDRIAAVGLSMGGEEAIGAAAADPRIRAVVAEGATGRMAADLHWLSDVYGWRGAVQEVLSGAQTAVVDLLTPPPRPASLADGVRGATGPTLVIAAGTAPDEQHAAAALEAADDRVETWIVPGAAHMGGLATAHEEWATRVGGFLEAATGS